MKVRKTIEKWGTNPVLFSLPTEKPFVLEFDYCDPAIAAGAS